LQMHGLTMSTGDLDKGMTASGQSVGLVHDLPTIAELIKTIIAEAEAVQRRLALQIPVDGVAPQSEIRLVTPRT
ncbi:hypothetical protein SB912_24660, partial [Pantoea sp. SIMBA_072]